MKLNAWDWITMVLVIVGGLNWGLVGVFQYDLVAGIFGGGDPAAVLPRIIYVLVGLSALYVAFVVLPKANK